jgi:polar amino acid transport system substrate-binding protein
MKNLLVILAIVVSMSVGGLCEAKDKYKIATEGAYKPFNYILPDGTLAGFDVDIAKALCRQMGADCELVVQEWDGMIPGLLAKKFDFIVASMSITPERKKAVDFTDFYYEEAGLFVAKKGANLTFTKAGLKGKKIGVQRATTWANYLESTYGDAVEIKFYDTVENHNLDLLSGRLDLALANGIYMSDWVKTPEAKDFEITGAPVRDTKFIGEGCGITVRKGDTELRDKLNAALKAIIADGTHKKLSDKYFSTDIYPYK